MVEIKYFEWFFKSVSWINNKINTEDFNLKYFEGKYDQDFLIKLTSKNIKNMSWLKIYFYTNDGYKLIELIDLKKIQTLELEKKIDLGKILKDRLNIEIFHAIRYIEEKPIYLLVEYKKILQTKNIYFEYSNEKQEFKKINLKKGSK